MGQEITDTLKERFYDLPIDLCCVLDLDHFQITQANLSFEYILGWKPEEIIGKKLDEFVNSGEDRAAIEKAFSKVQRNIHSLSFETEFHCKNTQLRWIAWKCYVDTETQKLFAVGRDITPYIEMQKTLLAQSQIDHLTGIFDRQALMSLLQKEVNGAARFHNSTTLILIDIDGFKEYNSRYGLPQGDVCLKQVATTLKTCLRRKTDFLARFENDSFGVILTHNNLEKAAKSAEYLRMNVEKMAVKHVEDDTLHRITISLGVASVSDTAEKEVTSDQMLTAALHTLEISKQSGGNQVNCAIEFK